MTTPADIDPEESATPEQDVPDQSPEVSAADEIAQYKDLALRSRAELDNYRKRVVREKEEAIRYANGALLEDLLPILDNFELGLSAAKHAPEAAGIVQGLEMVRKQLEDFLRAHGVETLDAVGAPFDPNVHDAVAEEHSDEVAESHVLRQSRRGFKLRDRLIRPASVVVSKGPAGA